MAGVQDSALAVAVSNAGGLGSLPCAVLGLDTIRKELAAIRAQTTRPCNVNFFCHTPPEPFTARRLMGNPWERPGLLDGFRPTPGLAILAARGGPLNGRHGPREPCGLRPIDERGIAAPTVRV